MNKNNYNFNVRKYQNNFKKYLKEEYLKIDVELINFYFNNYDVEYLKYLFKIKNKEIIFQKNKNNYYFENNLIFRKYDIYIKYEDILIILLYLDYNKIDFENYINNEIDNSYFLLEEL